MQTQGTAEHLPKSKWTLFNAPTVPEAGKPRSGKGTLPAGAAPSRAGDDDEFAGSVEDWPGFFWSVVTDPDFRRTAEARNANFPEFPGAAARS